MCRNQLLRLINRVPRQPRLGRPNAVVHLDAVDQIVLDLGLLADKLLDRVRLVRIGRIHSDGGDDIIHISDGKGVDVPASIIVGRANSTGYRTTRKPQILAVSRGGRCGCERDGHQERGQRDDDDEKSVQSVNGHSTFIVRRNDLPSAVPGRDLIHSAETSLASAPIGTSGFRPDRFGFPILVNADPHPRSLAGSTSMALLGTRGSPQASPETAGRV